MEAFSWVRINAHIAKFPPVADWQILDRLSLEHPGEHQPIERVNGETGFDIRIEVVRRATLGRSEPREVVLDRGRELISQARGFALFRMRSACKEAAQDAQSDCCKPSRMHGSPQRSMPTLFNASFTSV